MATPYLVLTDGTTTITINTTGGAVGDYALEDWVPAIAGLRTSQIGGRGPYEDVVEEMSLVIIDTTAAGCYTRLDTLNRLLDQAERWYNNENATAVLIKYAPGGASVSSSGTPLQAAILGRAPGNATSGVGIRAIQKTQFTFHMPITLRFWRKGRWLLSTTAASSASTTNGALASITIAAVNNLSPVKLSFDNYGWGNDASKAFHGGFIAVSDVLNTIAISTAESAASGAYTSFNDSAQNARDTNVLRYTPAVTTEVASGSVALTIASTARTIGVFANMRNNSTTTSYSMRIAFDSGYRSYTPMYYVAPQATAYPYWRFIGTASSNGYSPFYTVYLTASAASGTLDIDTLVFVDLSNPTTQVIAVLENTYSNGQSTLEIDHQELTKPQPKLTVASDFTNAYLGDLIINNKGGTVYALLMATGRATAGAGNHWRQVDNTPTLLANTWTATRYTAYLTPV